MNSINVFRSATVATISAMLILAIGCGDDDNPFKAPEVTHGSFTDSRDGKTYRTVTINSQTWMAENLNYAATGNGSACYRNEESNCNIYGRLYNWNTAMTACPEGWHLPTNAEWTTLVNAAGGASTAGTKLKSSTVWQLDDYFDTPPGTDDFGFSALPGGFRSVDYYGGSSSFYLIGQDGYWWTASENSLDTTIARFRWMSDDSEQVGVEGREKRYGKSVRCVMN